MQNKITQKVSLELEVISITYEYYQLMRISEMISQVTNLFQSTESDTKKRKSKSKQKVATSIMKDIGQSAIDKTTIESEPSALEFSGRVRNEVKGPNQI